MTIGMISWLSYTPGPFTALATYLKWNEVNFSLSNPKDTVTYHNRDQIHILQQQRDDLFFRVWNNIPVVLISFLNIFREGL